MTSITMTPTPRALSRLEQLGQYLATDPNNTALLKDYAREAWSAQEREACLKALRRLQRLDALDVEHTALLGRVLAAGGEPAAAVAELQCAVKRWPESARLSFELARSLFATGEPDEALRRLPERDDDPNLDAAIGALRVRLLHHADHLPEAVEAAARFGTALPVGVEAALLPVLIDLGETAEAVRRAERMAGSAGDALPYEACEPMAIAALDGQHVARSREWIERALRLRRDDGRIWLLAALTHLQASEMTAAGEAIARAVELMPGHAGSHLAQGWIELLAGDVAGARAAFESGVHASPAFAEGYGSLAVIEILQGRATEAETLIRKALMLDKHCASAQYAQTLRRGESPVRVQELARLVLLRARTSRARPQ